MSLRLLGIDPASGARGYGVDRYAAEGSLANRFAQGQGYADDGGTVGVGPVYNATLDSGASRAAAFVQGRAAHGDGPDYRPAAPLPAVGVLEYVQKFSTASLASIGLLVLLVVIARNPRAAFRWIARSGARRAGLE